MRGYDCYFVAVVEGEVGVNEDEYVGDGGGEGEGFFKEVPGVGVGVKDYGQEGGRGLWRGGALSVCVCDGKIYGGWGCCLPSEVLS